MRNFAIFLLIILIFAGFLEYLTPWESFVPNNARYRVNDSAYFNISRKNMFEQGLAYRSANIYEGVGEMGQIYFGQ